MTDEERLKRFAAMNEETRKKVDALLLIDHRKISRFVNVMNDLIDSERSNNPGSWIHRAHEERHELWTSMTEEEKQTARKLLGPRAKWC